MLRGVIWREWQALLRHPQQIVNPLAFLALAVMLFGVALPRLAAVGNPTVLLIYGASTLWVIVLLTSILSLDSLFRRDYDNGTLEQVLLASTPPFLVVLVRIGLQWLYSGLLIALVSPLLGYAVDLPADALDDLALPLLLGTPALSLFGAIGAALTVGFNRGGVILALLVLPLFLPVLIFGVGAVTEHAGQGEAQLYWLVFISMLALTIGPLAATAGLKISVQLQ